MCARSPDHGTIRNSTAINCLRLCTALEFTTGTCRVGGLRHARRDSANTGWRNASFRGYADYMQTSAFAESLAHCIELAKGERTVLMCAEAVPWRCHRSLIADALLVRGIEVKEITSGIRTRPQALTPWARVNGTHVTYPDASRAPARRHSTHTAKSIPSHRFASGQ